MKINQRDDKGRHHGYWVEYYFSGQLYYKGTYKHARQHGLWIWCSDEKLLSKGEYNNDKRRGLFFDSRYKK